MSNSPLSYTKPKRVSQSTIDKDVILTIVAVIGALVITSFAIWGISIAVRTYSYHTIELSREAPFSKVYPVDREYRAAYTEVYYTTDGEGKRHRHTRYHEAEYYFRYDGYRHHVRKSIYDSAVTKAIITYQNVTYKRIPNFPDYPNKVDENPYVGTITVGDVEYR